MPVVSVQFLQIYAGETKNFGVEFYIKVEYKPGMRQCLLSQIEGNGNLFYEMPWCRLKALSEG